MPDTKQFPVVFGHWNRQNKRTTPQKMQSDMVQNYWLKITIQIPREFYFSKHPNIFSFVVPFPGYLPPSPSALSSHAVRSQSVVHGHCDNGLSKTAVRQVSDSVPRFGMVKMWAFEKVVWWPSNYTTQKITLKHLVYIYIMYVLIVGLSDLKLLVQIHWI